MLLRPSNFKPFFLKFSINLSWLVITYMWCCEETFGSTLVSISELSQLPQTEGFAVQSPATAFWHTQCTVTVLNTTFILPLRQSKREHKVNIKSSYPPHSENTAHNIMILKFHFILLFTSQLLKSFTSDCLIHLSVMWQTLNTHLLLSLLKHFVCGSTSRFHNLENI